MPLSASLEMTPLCRMLDLTAPVVQAPVGSATTPELVAAVSNAGGLGMLALTWTPAGSVRESIRATRALTDRPFGVNLVLEWAQEERVQACAEESVAAVSTFWGAPRPYVDRIDAGGALHLHTVGSAEEARRAVQAGVDVIVARGWAAGGVADGRGLAAVLVLGADAAWVGTRFLLAQEANVHDEWRARIRDASETSTVYATVFDGGWPDSPHRALRNSTVEAWERAGRPAAPGRPGEGEVVARAPDGTCLYRYGAEIPVRRATGDVEALAHYAGQSAAIVQDVRPAATIVDELVRGAAEALRSGDVQR